MTITSETRSESTTADMPNTRTAHRRFLGEVVTLLKRSGFPHAGISPASGLLTLTAGREDDPQTATEWGLEVHAQRDHRVAEHVDAARGAADDAGLRFAASVQRRYGHDTGSAYCTIELGSLVAILQRLEADNCTKTEGRRLAFCASRRDQPRHPALQAIPAPSTSRRTQEGLGQGTLDAMTDDDSAVTLWVAAGTSVLLPMALGSGPLGAVMGAISTVAVAPTTKLGRRLLGRSFDNIGYCLEVAADLHHVGVEIFTEQLADEDDAERIELTARVLQAAGSASFPKKVAALGKVLAAGVREDGNVAEALVLARAIGALDAAHVVVLAYLATSPVPPPELLTEHQQGTVGWQASKLAQVLPQYSDVTDGLIATLSAQGLLRDASASNWASQNGEVTWVITPVGERVLTVLPGS